MQTKFDPCPSCGAVKWEIDYDSLWDDDGEHEFEIDVCSHCGWHGGHDPEAWRTNEHNRLVRAKVAEIEREIREGLDKLVIGAVENAVIAIQAQEHYESVIAKLNDGPLEDRLRFFAHVYGIDFKEARDSIREVKFSVEVTPHADIPGLLDVSIKVDVLTKVKVEVVHVRAVVTGDKG